MTFSVHLLESLRFYSNQQQKTQNSFSVLMLIRNYKFSFIFVH